MSSPHKDESEVLDDVFGDSSDTENTAESSHESESEQLESDEERDKTKKAPIKKTPADSEATGTDDKILEARRDFEEALSKIKGGRRKRDSESDSVNYDDFAVSFINKMYDALRRDDEAVKAETPALAKLKMLDEVTETIAKKHLQEVFLDNQVLDAIKKWLEPNIRGHLSVVSVRKRLLELLHALPIETVHLRESGIGRIVMFYYQRKAESLEIRKLAGDLITTWSRPILGTSLNYSEMIQSVTTSRDEKDGNNHSNDPLAAAASMKRLQSEHFKKMAKSGALERDTASDQRYRSIISKQKNRKR